MPAPPAPLNPPQAFKQRVNEISLAREMLYRSESVSGAGLSQNAKFLLGTLHGYASRNSISPYNLGIYKRYGSIQRDYLGSVSSCYDHCPQGIARRERLLSFCEEAGWGVDRGKLCNG